MVQKDLFGGAIIANFPENLIDVAKLRQVPDNQEVFLYSDSNASIIIEVLQRIPKQNDEAAVKFHFEALAYDNDAESSTMELPSVLRNDRGDQTPSPILLRGSQRIRKFNAVAPDNVDILLALFRVFTTDKSADLVVSASIPTAKEVGVGKQHTLAVESDFSKLVSSLRIVDYGLFC